MYLFLSRPVHRKDFQLRTIRSQLQQVFRIVTSMIMKFSEAWSTKRSPHWRIVHWRRKCQRCIGHYVIHCCNGCRQITTRSAHGMCLWLMWCPDIVYNNGDTIVGRLPIILLLLSVLGWRWTRNRVRLNTSDKESWYTALILRCIIVSYRWRLKIDVSISNSQSKS